MYVSTTANSYPTTQTVTIGGTASTIGTWVYPHVTPNRSSQCPYCTPRCPHGYPADFAPTAPFPWVIYC